MVAEVKIEGGYRKPEWRDLVIVQTALLPYTLFLYAKKYHRRYISKEVNTHIYSTNSAYRELLFCVWCAICCWAQCCRNCA